MVALGLWELEGPSRWAGLRLQETEDGGPSQAVGTRAGIRAGPPRLSPVLFPLNAGTSGSHCNPLCTQCALLAVYPQHAGLGVLLPEPDGFVLPGVAGRWEGA